MLRAQLRQAEAVKERLKANLWQLKTKIVDTSSLVALYTQAQAAAKKSEEEARDARKEAELVRRQLDRLLAEVAPLREQVQHMEQMRAEQEAQAVRKEQQLQASKALVAQLQAGLAQLQARLESHEQLQREHQKLQRDLRQRDEQLLRARSRADQLECQLRELQRAEEKRRRLASSSSAAAASEAPEETLVRQERANEEGGPERPEEEPSAAAASAMELESAPASTRASKRRTPPIEEEPEWIRMDESAASEEEQESPIREQQPADATAAEAVVTDADVAEADAEAAAERIAALRAEAQHAVWACGHADAVADVEAAAEAAAEAVERAAAAGGAAGGRALWLELATRAWAERAPGALRHAPASPLPALRALSRLAPLAPRRGPLRDALLCILRHHERALPAPPASHAEFRAALALSPPPGVAAAPSLEECLDALVARATRVRSRPGGGEGWVARETFEAVKALELVGAYLGHEAAHDLLLVERLWPLLPRGPLDAQLAVLRLAGLLGRLSLQPNPRAARDLARKVALVLDPQGPFAPALQAEAARALLELLPEPRQPHVRADDAEQWKDARVLLARLRSWFAGLTDLQRASLPQSLLDLLRLLSPCPVSEPG